MTRNEIIERISIEENPAIKQKLKDALEKIDLFAKEEEPLLLDLKTIGIEVESVWDLVNNKPIPHLKTNFLGKYNIAYPTLVKHLDNKYHPRIMEGIIRALTEKAAKDIACEKILGMFYKEQDRNMKWVLANALRTLLSSKKREEHPEIDKTWKGIKE